MFEITDEFLAQAGFTSLPQVQIEDLKRRVAARVEKEIGLRVAAVVGEDRAAEIERLINGDPGLTDRVLRRNNPQYRETPEFAALQQEADSEGVSVEEILRDSAIMVWFAEQGIDVHSIAQESMNSAMVWLQEAYATAAGAMK